MSLNLYDSNNKTLTPLAGNSRNPVQGATSSADGVAGLVPAPLIADRNKFLKGDGTWAECSGGSGSNTSNFIGTRAEWEALSQSEKDAFDTMDFTDEYSEVPIDNTPTANSDNLVKSGGVYSAIQDLTNYTNSQTNPNLLDNPWFTVNQRGLTSVSTNNEIIVDRWRFQNVSTEASISVDNDGLLANLKSNDGIKQHFDDLIPDGVYTLSTKINGVIYSKTFNITNGITPVGKFDESMPYSYAVVKSASKSIVFPLVIYGTTLIENIRISAVKLELGSVSTLAQDTAPNYATELLKCQRYFERVNINSQVGYPSVTASNGTMIIFTIPFKVTKRTTPRLRSDVTSIQTRIAGTAYSGSTITSGTSTVDYGNVVFSPSETAPVASSGTTIILTGSYIDFTAEL